MRRVGVWFVLFLIGCSASPAPLPETSTVRDTPLWATPGGDPDAGADGSHQAEDLAEKSPPKPAPIEATVHAVLRLRQGGAQDLVLLLEALSVERVVASIPAGRRCVAQPRYTKSREASGLQVRCGLSLGVSVWHRGDTLVIEPGEGPSSTVLLPADASVNFRGGVIADPEEKRCEGAAPRKKPITASLAFRAENPADPVHSQSVHLLVPELGADLRIGESWRQSCDSRYDPHETVFSASCTSGEISAELEARVVDGSIFFSASDQAHNSGAREELGGFFLPCGAKVNFPSLHRVGPGYLPPGEH